MGLICWNIHANEKSDEKRALAILGDAWHCVEPLEKNIVRQIKEKGFLTDVIIDYEVSFDNIFDYDLIIISRYAWNDSKRFREKVYGTPKAKSQEMRWISIEQEDLLEAFVNRGGSLFLHHDGIGYYPKGGGINRLSKAFFVNHPPRTHISLKPTGKLSELMKGVDVFELVDEEFNVELDESQTQVFLESYSEENGRYPQGWAHSYGKGKVVVFIPGHSTESLEHPMVRKSISNVIEWLK